MRLILKPFIVLVKFCTTNIAVGLPASRDSSSRPCASLRLQHNTHAISRVRGRYAYFEHAENNRLLTSIDSRKELCSVASLPSTAGLGPLISNRLSIWSCSRPARTTDPLHILSTITACSGSEPPTLLAAAAVVPSAAAAASAVYHACAVSVFHEPCIQTQRLSPQVAFCADSAVQFSAIRGHTGVSLQNSHSRLPEMSCHFPAFSSHRHKLLHLGCLATCW